MSERPYVRLYEDGRLALVYYDDSCHVWPGKTILDFDRLAANQRALDIGDAYCSELVSEPGLVRVESKEF